MLMRDLDGHQIGLQTLWQWPKFIFTNLLQAMGENKKSSAQPVVIKTLDKVYIHQVSNQITSSLQTLPQIKLVCLSMPSFSASLLLAGKAKKIQLKCDTEAGSGLRIIN